MCQIFDEVQKVSKCGWFDMPLRSTFEIGIQIILLKIDGFLQRLDLKDHLSWCLNKQVLSINPVTDLGRLPQWMRGCGWVEIPVAGQEVYLLTILDIYYWIRDPPLAMLEVTGLMSTCCLLQSIMFRESLKWQCYQILVGTSIGHSHPPSFLWLSHFVYIVACRVGLLIFSKEILSVLVSCV